MTAIRNLRKEGLTDDELKSVMEFAIEGMSLRDYVSQPLLLSLYARYFIYLELQKASHVYTLYDGKEHVGVLMLDMAGEAKPYQNWRQQLYVACVDLIQTLFFGKSAGVYNAVNKKLLQAATTKHSFDGELNFFAVANRYKGQGLGTVLLNHIQTVHQGQQIYLYTDSGSSYPFYEKRGFDCLAQETIQMTINHQEQEMTCMFFAKRL